jgi:hypothetical protein
VRIYRRLQEGADLQRGDRAGRVLGGAISREPSCPACDAAQARPPRRKDDHGHGGKRRVLKDELTPGHGVRFTETETLSDGSETRGAQGRKGAFQFNKKGVGASDTRVIMLDAQLQRAIGVGKICLNSGAMLQGALPEGGTWP